MQVAFSRGVLVQKLLAIANTTHDDVVYAYAMLIANAHSQRDDVEEMVLTMVRALAENRRYLLDRETKRIRNTIDPPVIIIDRRELSLEPGSIVQVTQPHICGGWLDTVSFGDFFQSMRRRLTKRLRAWYKGLH